MVEPITKPATNKSSTKLKFNLQLKGFMSGLVVATCLEVVVVVAESLAGSGFGSRGFVGSWFCHGWFGNIRFGGIRLGYIMFERVWQRWVLQNQWHWQV